jgi:hypothetical protein
MIFPSGLQVTGQPARPFTPGVADLRLSSHALENEVLG